MKLQLNMTLIKMVKLQVRQGNDVLVFDYFIHLIVVFNQVDLLQ